MAEIEIVKPEDLSKLHEMTIKELTVQNDGAPYYRFRLHHPLAEKDVYLSIVPVISFELKGVTGINTAAVGLKVKDCED